MCKAICPSFFKGGHKYITNLILSNPSRCQSQIWGILIECLIRLINVSTDSEHTVSIVDWHEPFWRCFSSGTIFDFGLLHTSRSYKYLMQGIAFHQIYLLVSWAQFQYCIILIKYCLLCCELFNSIFMLSVLCQGFIYLWNDLVSLFLSVFFVYYNIFNVTNLFLRLCHILSSNLTIVSFRKILKIFKVWRLSADLLSVLLI